MRTNGLAAVILTSSVFAAGTVLSSSARATGYPTKTVHFVIGFSAGGAPISRRAFSRGA